ncbi:MAG: excinuclease ABC subunit C [Candidatus Aminicenantes bacterium]|nr:excinuclease ABC subunit C [Candidatus Aminicenantes bacterium]
METNGPPFTRALDIPENPGCYIFRDKAGKIIYIGKAKNLEKRVHSYFQKKDRSFDPKTEQLVKNIAAVDFIVTANEVEALILESSLIKKNTPKYNINLKDSKNFAYIYVTDEKFPRLRILRNKTAKGEFFGPFVSAAARDYILAAVNKVFQLRTCKKMPKKPCLRHQLRLCRAPCINGIGEAEYAGKIRRVKLILKGRTKELITGLSDEMANAAAELNFEHALELRNQVEAIKSLQERQNMDRKKKYDEDIVNFLVKGGKVYLMLFNVYKGILENKQEYEFDYKEDFFEEFLLMYYSDNKVPAELIVPEKLGPAFVSYLREKGRKAVTVKIPEKGEKKQLLELVKKNIEMTFFGARIKLRDLQRRLKLPQTPTVIECFDISHLSGTSMVASMVQFREGRADKSNYRRFKIETISGIDDTGAIAEVVKRRYTRLLKKEKALPDLVIIDGGKGQLNAALAEIEQLGLEIPTIAIAKRFEEIYMPGIERPLRLGKKTKALQLVQQIRDETHRFAIAYNRLLRKKELLK